MTATVHSLYVSLQMHSDLFLSRQRKPRSRQLRKPLVVQVWQQRKGIISLFHENLRSTQLDWESVMYGILAVRVKRARVCYFCFIYSEHSYPELREILLSTSAPSLSSPTRLPQVNIKSNHCSSWNAVTFLKSKTFIGIILLNNTHTLLMCSRYAWFLSFFLFFF